MTEQKIEKIIIDQIAELNLPKLQVVGTWQASSVGDVKAVGDSAAAAVVTVKVSPRSYDTFTIPEASFEVAVELNVRAEIDAGGRSYLEMTDAVQDVIHAWQKSFADYKAAFEISGEFSPTGFRLDGGDCGFNSNMTVWTWLQKFTVQGVVKKNKEG